MERRDASRFLSAVCILLVLSPLSRSASADIQKWLIMPGPVIAGHAGIESECSACHSPLEKRPQGELCLDCHAEVHEDVAAATGFHGRLPAGERVACASCHTEHEGRDVDIAVLDIARFDHARTDFALTGHHADVACGACHTGGAAHRDAPVACVACHRADDVHAGSLGGDCASCHTPQHWTRTTFEHAATGFPLAGAHAGLACTACHADKQFVAAGGACIDCHRADDVHRGQNGTQCADCHGNTAWTQVDFDHAAVSGFPLTGGHRGLGCRSCHLGGNDGKAAGRSCVACHGGGDPHAGRFGAACEGCHRTSGWRGPGFDHAAKTGFALPPGHEALACTDCHTGKLDDPLPRDCGSCHAANDPHGGQLGNACESCHAPASWTAELWFDHDITRFPLLGAHAALACRQCHATAAFHDAGTACTSCHRDDDPHGGSLGQQCESCHNPADWQVRQFDHDRQTAFALTGAHARLGCGACHRGDTPAADAATDCIGCHRRDDPHSGRFGNDCGNCHGTSSFSRIEGF